MKGIPPAPAARGHLGQQGIQSDSLPRGTRFGKGPDELLVQILTADRAETGPQASGRKSQLPAGSPDLGTPYQDT